MAIETKRPLKVFLCHASGDKPPVRDLYKRLVTEGVDAWLDQEKLLPGQDWRSEIPRAVQESDVVVIFLSKKSTTKEGYVQKEIRFALDIAEEKPEGAIFLIPARLEDCAVPERLSRWQWVDLYEENGFIRLLRSLKLRADKVNATLEPVSYEDEDKELEQRLEQLYTEGLAAFYTEDWDRACHRFQSILSQRPNHTRAAVKLTEADRQRDLANLYTQATDAIRTEDWGMSIKILEELTRKSLDYKDAARLLNDSRRQKQLKELYAEAKTLSAAQKWRAIVRVFEQIHIIDPNYPDPDELLISAQKEAAELQRLAALNDQYSHALREMDSGNWLEARKLLEQVHKAQTGFLDTERLLKKVEDEISRADEKRQQNDQVNTLYEQAHGLLRSKKWRNALDKLEQIRELDDQFPDTDGIAEKAQNELAREEQEAERQNQLAALYAEAVKLLKEEKYQDALDKWQEVKAIDSKYPDRQWVQRTAKNKLSESTRPLQLKSRFPISRLTLIKIIGIALFFALVIVVTRLWIQKNEYPSMYDNFNNIIYNGRFNPNKWMEEQSSGDARQNAGKLVLTQSVQNTQRAQTLIVKNFNYAPEKVTSIQADLMMDPIEVNHALELHIVTSKRSFLCGLTSSIWHCFYEYPPSRPRDVTTFSDSPAQNGRWYTFYVEVNPLNNIALFYVDNRQIGSVALEVDEVLTETRINLWNGSGTPVTGFVDNVMIQTRDAP